MKSVHVLFTMLTGGFICASLTGCTTVNNHYPAGVASYSPQPAPVYVAAAGQCQCAMNQAPAGYASAAGHAGCPVCAASHSGHYSYAPYPNTSDYAARPNPYPQQGSATDYYPPSYQSEVNNETHVVYVPVTPPTVPQEERTDADRARDAIDIAIDVLREAAEDDSEERPRNSGSNGSGRPRGTVTGGVAVGGRAGNGSSTGNTGGTSAGNTGAPGGRATTPSTPATSANGSNTGNLAGRAPATNTTASVPASANGSNTGTFNGTTGPGGRATTPSTPASSANGSNTGNLAGRAPTTTASVPASANGSNGGELTARPTTSGTSSTNHPVIGSTSASSSTTGGAQGTVQRSDKPARTIPGTGGTQSTETAQGAQVSNATQPKASTPAALPASTISTPGTVVGKKEEVKEEKAEKEQAQNNPSTIVQPASQTETVQVQGTFSQPTIVTSPKVIQAPAAQAGGTGTVAPIKK